MNPAAPYARPAPRRGTSDGGPEPRPERAPLLLAAVLACSAACAGGPGRPGPTVGPEPSAPLPDPVNTPVNRETGEVLEATVPLVDGDGLALTGLRGRVVVLELTGTWTDRWSETYPFYARLLQQHGPERLAVVVVAMDGERATLSPEPGVRGPGFDLGWDPQGALAARLQVAALPTVVVLDREGRITYVQGDVPRGEARAIEDAVARAISGP